MSVLWGNIQDVENFYCFDVIQRVSLLQIRNYSSYQQFLHKTISYLRNKGMTFGKIAIWLNEKGYSTVRGGKFRSPHIHSILKKRRKFDERTTKQYEPKPTNFRMYFVDNSLINQE